MTDGLSTPERRADSEQTWELRFAALERQVEAQRRAEGELRRLVTHLQQDLDGVRSALRRLR